MTVPTVAFDGGDERGGGGHFSRFRQRADFEREVDAQRLLDVQLHGVLHGPEPLQLGLDLIHARGHRRKRVVPGLVADLRADRVGGHILRRHRGAGNRGARLVLHFTGDGAEGLGVSRGTEKEPNDNAENHVETCAAPMGKRERNWDRDPTTWGNGSQPTTIYEG